MSRLRKVVSGPGEMAEVIDRAARDIQDLQVCNHCHCATHTTLLAFTSVAKGH